MKAEKEAKEKAANGSAEKSNGEAKSEDKADGNCVAKPETNGKHTPKDKEAKSSPAAKEVKTGSPSADKALIKETASPAAKESKSSPASKEAKASPAGKDKEAKSSPASKDVKSSPKDAKAASNGKDAEMTSPKNVDKAASPEAKKGPTAELKVDEEMEVEVTSKKEENGHIKKANGKSTVSSCALSFPLRSFGVTVSHFYLVDIFQT